VRGVLNDAVVIYCADVTLKEPPFEVSYQTARFDPIVPFAKARFGIEEGCSGCFCRAWAFARL
jgi:hypothetical protein